MDIEKQEIDEFTKGVKAIGEGIAEMLSEIMKYLERQSQFAPRKELAKWIKDGNGVYAYPVKGNANELKGELMRQSIPYVETSTGYLIVKLSDAERVRDADIKINIAKSNYYQEVDGKKMEDAIAKTPAIKDKQILSISGLDKYDIEVMKNKCNNITSGFMVGITRNKDKSHSLSVRGNKTYNPDPEKNDFCKAMLSAMFSLYGPNRNIKRKQVEADEQVDREVAAAKDAEDTIYIVGAHGSPGYIEITQDKFEFYEPRNTYKEKLEVVTATVRKDDPSYEIELQRYMDKIRDRMIIRTTGDLEAFRGGTLKAESIRPVKNKEQYVRAKAENQIVNEINRLIKEYAIRKNIPVQDMDEPEEKLGFFVKQTSIVMNALSEEKVPNGYREGDIKELDKIFKDNGINPKEYKAVIEKIASLSIESHQARAEGIFEKNAELTPKKDTSYKREEAR